MLTWATVVALAIGAVVAVSTDLSSLLIGMAELGGVVALFALVCAVEAYN
jgi:hypothetical protein